MAITFANYPSSNRVPGVFAEIDPSNANSGTVNQRTLLVGQMLAAGTATANTPILASSYTAARTAFGVGSMLSLMYQQYRRSDTFGEVWLLPIAENGAGTAATNTLTVAGTATAAGTLNVYVCGTNVQVAVASGAASTVVAAAINTAINAAIDLPVTSGVSTSVVTVTARAKGITAGDIDLRLNYAGPAAGEVTPAGITVTIAAGTAGTGEPSMTSVFANLGDNAFDYIVFPFSGATELAAVTTLLNDTTGRWSWQTELFGHAFTAKEASVSGLVTYGLTMNDQHISALGINDTPTPIYNVAADFGAVCANSLRADPALPLQNIVMNVQAPPRASRFLLSERNSLYYGGVGAVRVNDAGQVILDRAPTLYRTNAAGAADNSYLDTETLACLQFVIRDLRDLLATKYARKKLVADGSNIPGGSAFVTSQTIKAEVIAWYRKQAAAGIVQNMETFTKNVQATNAGNGRVSLLLPIDVANQLRITSMLVQFVKS